MTDALASLARADRAANNIPCTAYRKNGERVTLRSQDVRPGDILEVKRDEPFPADMILLASSTMTVREYLRQGRR